MRAKQGQSGQTLIETALVIPLLGIFVFGVVWLLCFSHNAIALEEVALDKARAVSADSSAILIFTAKPMWGQSTPALIHRNTTRVPLWRPFIPSIVPVPFLPTVQRAEGSIAHIECSTTMMGKGQWTAYFLPYRLKVTAETLIEAPLPPNS